VLSAWLIKVAGAESQVGWRQRDQIGRNFDIWEKLYIYQIFGALSVKSTTIKLFSIH
jgi:hypothetical protein